MRRNTVGNVLPVDFSGERLNIQTDKQSGRVWVCIDGQSVFRANKLKDITLNDQPVMDRNDVLREAIKVLRTHPHKKHVITDTCINACVGTLESMLVAESEMVYG